MAIEHGKCDVLHFNCIVINFFFFFLQSGDSATDNGVDCRPMVMKSIKGSFDTSSVSEPEETYGSVRTDLSDTQLSCQHSVSTNRSAAIVVPSPMMHQRPSQLDVG